MGLGALAFYGLGFGNEAGALDKSIAWPQHVKQRRINCKDKKPV